MKFLFSARSAAQSDCEYVSFASHGLTSGEKCLGGDGQPETPYHYKIRIHNQNPHNWSGVIHIELLFLKESPRFFLPAFMYGRNRGEFPQNVIHEFPRIRENDARRPSSPWWMVRSDG